MLAILFAQFPSHTSGDPKLRMEGYFYALSDICSEALGCAVRAILKGETDCDPKFMPTAPQLARICRRFQGYQERELRRAKRQQSQLDGAGYYLEDWMEPAGEMRCIGSALQHGKEHHA